MRTLPMLLALTFAACQPAAPERIPGDMPRDGVALETVNGKPVTQGMLDALLGTIPEATRKQLEEAGQIDRVKEELITTDALYQEALAKNLHKDAKVQTQLLMAERTVLVNHLVRTEVDARTTDEAMKKWYDEHLVQFRIGPGVAQAVGHADGHGTQAIRRHHQFTRRLCTRGGGQGLVERAHGLPGVTHAFQAHGQRVRGGQRRLSAAAGVAGVGQFVGGVQGHVESARLSAAQGHAAQQFTVQKPRVRVLLPAQHRAQRQSLLQHLGVLPQAREVDAGPGRRLHGLVGQTQALRALGRVPCGLQAHAGGHIHAGGVTQPSGQRGLKFGVVHVGVHGPEAVLALNFGMGGTK